MEKVLDLAAMGKALGVPEIASYGPNGQGPIYSQVWSKDYVLRLLAQIEPDTNGNTYILTGHVDPWISAAVLHRLAASDVYFRVPAGDTKLTPMHRGPCPYEGIITAEICGDDVFVKADFDKLEGLVGGPLQVDLDALAIPDFPADKNVYFHGIGKFPFQMRAVFTLMPNCRSLSCASGNAEVYQCAIPSGTMQEVGDSFPVR